MRNSYKKKFYGLFFIVCWMGWHPSWGAIDRSVAGKSKKYQYIEYGTITGGEAGFLYTLLNLRRVASPKDKIERIILDLGDDKGQPLKKHVSYYQISLEKDRTRVNIDLSQMNASGIDQKKLLDIFKSSKLVSTAKINFDPVDTAITIQLQLKKKIQLEAFEISGPGIASRIAIDLREKVLKK